MESILSTLTQTTKTIQSLNDITFQKAAHPKIAKQFNAITNSLLSLSNTLLKYTTQENETYIPLTLQNINDSYQNVTQITDSLLEKANHLMDTSPLLYTQPKQKKQKLTLPRPQSLFAHTIDNTNTPFIRKILFKPNAKRPLDTTTNPLEFVYSLNN